MTDEQYYQNKKEWGSSQFVTLENIIDNIKLKSGEDSFFKKMDTHYATILAKQGLYKFGQYIPKKNEAITIDVSPTKIFPFPRYMNNWHRVSVVNSCKNLVPLNINNNPSVKNYLQSHDYKLLFDHNGAVLEGSELSFKNGGSCYEIQDCNKPCIDKNNYSGSWIKDNISEGYFSFSDDLVGKSVVIEYSGSSLDNISNCNLKIHKNLELTIEYWIKWNFLEGNKNVSQRQVSYFFNRYKLEYNQSKNLLSEKITLIDILTETSKRF